MRRSRDGTPRASAVGGELWRKRKNLGEMLIGQARITPATLQKLFHKHEGNMIRLGEMILERGMMDRASLIKALEEVSRVRYLHCSSIRCERAALEMISKATAIRLGVLSVEVNPSRMIVVMVEPHNVATIDELRFTAGRNIVPCFGFRAEILSAIVRNYDDFESVAASRLGRSTREGAEGELVATGRVLGESGSDS